MAKRRTRKDKIIAQLRRQMRSQEVEESGETFQYSSTASKPDLQTKRPFRTIDAKNTFLSLFLYDPVLIKKDLLRTALFATIAFGVIFGLFIYWK